MSRLIDADKLSEHKFTRESAKSSDYMRGWNDAIEAIIDNASTVEISQGELAEEIIDELESRMDYGQEYAQAMEDVIVILKAKFGMDMEAEND